MFTEVMPLLQKRRLLLSISPADGERIRVTLIPQKVTETEDNVSTTPLAITGTAAELDRELPAQLAEFVATHIQLQSTLATAKAEMEATAKASMRFGIDVGGELELKLDQAVLVYRNEQGSRHMATVHSVIQG
jgi:PRTRC genetic system protein E